MASDSQEATGPPIEIIARKLFAPWDFLPSIMPVALAVIGVFLIWGIRDALCLLLLGITVGFILLFIVRYTVPYRALIDGEGMTLLARGISRLRARPIHFRWDEIIEFRRVPVWMGLGAQFRLNRRRKSWTFRSQPKNSIPIHRGFHANPQFAEVVRLYVPVEKIHTDLPFDERHSLSNRYWWIFALGILVCAAITASCSLAIIRSEHLLGAIVAAVIALMIGAHAMDFCAHGAPTAFSLVTGLLRTFEVLVPASTLAFFISGGLALAAGGWGAVAGALVGAALMVINGKKRRVWQAAGVTLILAGAGFWCGWSEFHQIAGVRIGAGSLSGRSPWTPKGDAFWMTEGIWAKTATVCWYSSEAKLENRVVFSGSAYAVAVGEEAAIFRVRGEPEDQLWFFPRRGKPQVVDSAPCFGRGPTSPDSRHALVFLQDEKGETYAWRICDVETGKVGPVNLPMPLGKVSVIALRNDQTVLWLSGSVPLDKDNKLVESRAPLPGNGEFPHPGKPYIVWAWKVNSAAAPAQLYAARTQWLNWRRSGKPEQVDVCRISESRPAQREYVALDFTSSPPAEITISEEQFDTDWRMQHDDSFDGRFAATTMSEDVSAPPFIVDRKTGRQFHIRTWIAWFGVILHWSPNAHKFLMAIPETKYGGAAWRWRRDFNEAFEETIVVRLVDMDRQ
jgi:hypothetical protein